MQEDLNPYLKRGKLAMRKVTSSESIRRKLVLSGQDLRLLDILGEGIGNNILQHLESYRDVICR